MLMPKPTDSLRTRPPAEQIQALQAAQAWDRHVLSNSLDSKQRERVKARMAERERIIDKLKGEGK